MAHEHILLHDHRKEIRLQPLKVIFYMQGEIIEAISEQQEIYYLFFYKYRFLTAVKAKRIRLRSYIEHAFKQGMVFEAPHPLISNLLSTRREFQILTFNQLVNKLELHYSPQEQAYILTLFESFFPKKQLFETILSHYYEYRRNGQLALGYQIIRILMDFAPKQSLVKSLNQDVHFHKYAVLYNEKSAKVLAADPIFAEKTFYASRENELYFCQLKNFLEKKNRWMDLAALATSKRNKFPSDDEYHHLTALLETHFTEEETVFILEQLFRQYPAFLPLKQDLFNHYLNRKELGKLVGLLHEVEVKLNHSQLQNFEKMLEELDDEMMSLNSNQLKKTVNMLMSLLPRKVEWLLEKSVITLLKTQEPKDIKIWLTPYYHEETNLPIIGKIELMAKLSESLDDMQMLGELYFEFKQYDKALECFSWEMELNPSEPKPIKWLANTYREMGQKEESEMYQQLCVNVQKW